jgi:hypothetical protein
MKVFKTMVCLEGEASIYQMDTIEHEGKMWLGPSWLEASSEGWKMPERIICQNDLPHQKAPSTIQADFILNNPIPKFVLFDEIWEQSKYASLVIMRPDIRIPITPPTTQREESSLKLVKVINDPTPNGIIIQRLIKHLIMFLTEYTTLSNGQKKELFDILILIGKKLVSVYSHLKNYALEEDRLIELAKKAPIMKDHKFITVEHSQELFFEFDEFLVQVKSCLDYLVKVPAVVLGHKKWGLRTFGGKGKDVIRALQNNVPKEHKAMANFAILFINQSSPWVEKTIEARDKINHFIDGGINFEYFTVLAFNNDGKDILQIPMWSNEQSIRNFMEVTWVNLFRLCEDFVGSLIGFKIKSGYAFFHGAGGIDTAQSPWHITTKDKMHEMVSKPGWGKVE